MDFSNLNKQLHTPFPTSFDIRNSHAIVGNGDMGINGGLDAVKQLPAGNHAASALASA
jgi:hypothetical protein